MSAITEWLVNLPQYVAKAFGWLTQSVTIGDFTFSPLVMVGTGLATLAGIVLFLKIKNLIL